MLEITCQVAILRVFNRFGTFAHKVAQTWFDFDAKLELIKALVMQGLMLCGSFD